MAADIDPSAPQCFAAIPGVALWRKRLDALREQAAAPTRSAKRVLQWHATELILDRLLAQGAARSLTTAERRVAQYAVEAVRLFGTLSTPAKARLRNLIRAGLTGDASLIPLFHLLRTASLQRSRGFEVRFAGIEKEAPYDLLISRDGIEAELACDVISAEEGRGVHRGAWFQLVDRIDPELQTWLRAHPGRYILKLTLPRGLKEDSALLPALHARITQLLGEQRRADADEAAVLRLDPLTLAAAQADELGLMPRLRSEFGPEAHLAVTAAGGGVFVMAARAGQENEIAVAVRRRMETIVSGRLTGGRPGILAMFIDDTDRTEWRLLRERLELEGEARQFMTAPNARPVVAVTCASRLELFGLAEPDAVADGELRFRNPAHPAAKQPALAPAVASSL